MTSQSPFHTHCASILILSALVLLGCMPGVKVLYQHSDPALTLEHLEQGRVAVLPALSSTPLMDAEALAQVRSQLASGMSRARPTITQMEEARIHSSLRERPRLETALQRYSRTLAISREDLQQIGASMVAAGLLLAADSDPSRRLRPQPTTAHVTSMVHAQVAGTLSVFDALDGRAVWVGAAAVRSRKWETAKVTLDGRQLSSADVPAPEPPAMTTLSSRFFDALLGLWPK
jgi:hypothetical protein